MKTGTKWFYESLSLFRDSYEFFIAFKVLVYSVSSRQSLEELGQIVRTLREVKGDAQMGDVPVILVGNKADDAQVRPHALPYSKIDNLIP